MFAYEVTYWDEVNDKEENDHGIAYGDTFAEVNKDIVHYYGEDNIIELKLFAISERGNLFSPQWNIIFFLLMKK